MNEGWEWIWMDYALGVSWMYSLARGNGFGSAVGRGLASCAGYFGELGLAAVVLWPYQLRRNRGMYVLCCSVLPGSALSHGCALLCTVRCG